jgi:secreted Zn-dependent insulinase-like peptidase
MIIIEISSNRVIEALDILINALVDPLMLSETINDQIKILNDECNIAQFDDHYRATHLLASLARENHPIRQFSWGEKSCKEFSLI